MSKRTVDDMTRLAGIREVIRAANGDWHDATALWSVCADLDWLLERAELAASPEPASPGSGLAEAWKAAEDALPEGAVLMVGKTVECQSCEGYWATSSGPRDPETRYPAIVSSETGRPRGEHHDATPAAALLALAARLAASPDGAEADAG